MSCTIHLALVQPYTLSWVYPHKHARGMFSKRRSPTSLCCNARTTAKDVRSISLRVYEKCTLVFKSSITSWTETKKSGLRRRTILVWNNTWDRQTDSSNTACPDGLVDACSEWIIIIIIKSRVVRAVGSRGCGIMTKFWLDLNPDFKSEIKISAKHGHGTEKDFDTDTFIGYLKRIYKKNFSTSKKYLFFSCYISLHKLNACL